MKKKNEHIVEKVLSGSIAEEMEITPGDALLEINGHKIEDIFDYQYYTQDEYIEILVRKPSGEEWLLEIDNTTKILELLLRMVLWMITDPAITNVFSALLTRCLRACVIPCILKMMIPDFHSCREITLL